MQIITGTTDFKLQEKTAVAIGKFDGVHIGHRSLLAEILKQKENGKKACVFTFDPPPAVFFGKTEEKELTTKEEKRKIFAELGIDILIEFPMNATTAATPPEEFVQNILFTQMQAGFVAAGTDLSFGNKGAGNAVLLQQMAKECGVEVSIIDKILLHEKEVSSTYAREAVEQGNMELTEKLLGMPYSVEGVVEHGNHMGHKMGMPTVNLIPPKNKLLPPCGVYYAGVIMEGRYYKGISNIGYKPTVEEKEKRLGVETYLYGYDGNAYGKAVTVEFYSFKRPEQKFESLEALQKQVKEDIVSGQLYNR
ncbi:MAG: bifunctional riboflavin kinase/FAD synthetase [Lachnospiraceae bacterium]|nr:bifunctional riboflavin kinase/FAD synthetase [Lachnospiraceae bacterium]